MIHIPLPLPPPDYRFVSWPSRVCFLLETTYFADLQSRDPEMFKPVHVVNMNIKDSPEESAAAAGDVLNLCHMVTIVCVLCTVGHFFFVLSCSAFLNMLISVDLGLSRSLHGCCTGRSWCTCSTSRSHRGELI